MAKSSKTVIGEDRKVTAGGRYAELETLRDPYLQRARDCSALTIPSLLPPEGNTGASPLYQPFQSVGADGANNLAAKMLLVLFPPGEDFIRYTVDDFVLEELVLAAGNPEAGAAARAKIEEALGKIERAITNKMEQKGARKVLFEALLHLIVTGNGLLYVDTKGKLKFFRLDKFVIKRDLEGNVLDIIIKECIARVALPPEVVKAIAQADPLEEQQAQQSVKESDEVELYTWVKRQPNGSWKVHQEVEGIIVEGSQGTYPAEKSAWLPLRWSHVSGEDYGRGRCEEYYGDLMSLEEAAKSIVRFGAIASKVVFLNNAGGVTQMKDLVEASSGDIIEGNAADVTVLQVEKFQDFQLVKAIYDDCKERLEKAFLKVVQRQAERVTAEEIRLMAAELDQTLGGVYSIQAEELQRPLAVRIAHQMEKAKELPKLPEGVVSPQIVTGLDGLGRNTDMQKLDILLAGVKEIFGPQVIEKWVNAGDFIMRRAAALGIDTGGLIRSQEEVSEADQQANMMAMAQQAVGPGIGAMKDLAINNSQNMEAQTNGPTA